MASTSAAAVTVAFTGLIAAAAFRGPRTPPAPGSGSSQPDPVGGEAVVVGAWRRSPLGRFVDVMWVRDDGHRVLLAPSGAVARLVSSLYAFDRVEVVALRGGWDGCAVTVAAGPLRLRLVAGPRDWRSWLFALRPRPLRRWPRWLALEERVARPLVARLLGGGAGVRAAGRAPGGQREWYGVDDYRPIIDGSLRIDGRDAGRLAALPPDLGVGMSAFPALPAVVHLCALVEADGPAAR